MLKLKDIGAGSEDKTGRASVMSVRLLIVWSGCPGPVCYGPQSICGQCSQLHLTAPSNKEQAD